MDKLKQKSKFLSLVLRHDPGKINLTLDLEGWANVHDLIAKASSHGQHLTMDLLREIVKTNDKQRFTFSPDGMKIRANQGHSVDVDLGLQEQAPPAILYHGTHAPILPTIIQEGIKKMDRHHVHLTADADLAKKTGSRRGKPVLLTIDAEWMHREGCKFYVSENNVWLTDYVEPKYFLKREAPEDERSGKRISIQSQD